MFGPAELGIGSPEAPGGPETGLQDGETLWLMEFFEGRERNFAWPGGAEHEQWPVRGETVWLME